MNDTIKLCFECNKQFDDSCGQKCEDGEWHCEKCLTSSEMTHPKGWIDFNQKCVACDSDKVDHTDPNARPVHFICRACNEKWKDYGWASNGVVSSTDLDKAKELLTRCSRIVEGEIQTAAAIGFGDDTDFLIQLQADIDSFLNKGEGTGG